MQGHAARIRKTPAVQALTLRINAEGPAHAVGLVTLRAVIARYEKEEMPERHSTATSYKSQIKNHIRHRWTDVPLSLVKAMAIEDWLRSLSLAPKKLVRVRGGTKRLQPLRILAAEEFCGIPPLIPEPYRTQVWIAGFLGLPPVKSCPFGQNIHAARL